MIVTSRSRLLAAGLVLGVFAAAAASAASGHGSLDPSFGAGGKVTTSIGSFSVAQAVAVEPDGKLFVAGTTSTKVGDSVALARYLPNGSLDRTFGRNGRVITPVGPYCCEGYVSALVVQADGKPVLAGTSINSEGTDFDRGYVLRWNANGSLDRGFGKGGEVIFGSNVGETTSVAEGLVVRPDGKLVVSGAFIPEDLVYDTALVRYDPDGTPDPSFGNGGVVRTPGAGGAGPLLLQGDGKLVAGRAGSISQGYFFARYNANGGLDRSFGRGGRTPRIPLGQDGWIAGAAFEPDGKLVVAGTTLDDTDSVESITLARFDRRGNLDTSFGTRGTVTTSIAGSTCSGAATVAVQKDGKIVVGGHQRRVCGNEGSAAAETGFALFRYTAKGRLDPSFGSGGVVVTPMRSEGVAALTAQPDDKLVAAGSRRSPGSMRFQLVRYLP